MEKVKPNKKKPQKTQKLSFGQALKNNVIYSYIIFLLLLQIRNTTTTQGQKSKKSDGQKIIKNRKQGIPSSSISKIDESYNTDKAGDILNKEYDSVENKLDNKPYHQELQSDHSLMSNTIKVRKNN